MPGEPGPVQLGVVGLGFMGQTHASNAAALGHEIAAGADVAAGAREEFARTHDVPVYDRVEAMYNRERLDAVVVSTPNAAHEPAVVAALERGKDVLCEKPLAHNFESAARIAAADAESDGWCVVNFHNRISTAAATFLRERRSGRFGELTHVRATYIRSRGIPGGAGSWFLDEDLSGGGAVVDVGVHAIDFALHLLGYPRPEEVLAVTRRQFGTREGYVDPQGRFDDVGSGSFTVEDSATALIRCVGDRTISLDVAWAANEPPSNEVVVRGTDAGARMELGGEEVTVFEPDVGGSDGLVASTPASESLDPTGWTGCDERFLAAVATGDAPDLATTEQALTVQRVVDGIYRSAEVGRSVDVQGGG